MKLLVLLVLGLSPLASAGEPQAAATQAGSNEALAAAITSIPTLSPAEAQELIVSLLALLPSREDPKMKELIANILSQAQSPDAPPVQAVPATETPTPPPTPTAVAVAPPTPTSKARKQAGTPASGLQSPKLSTGSLQSSGGLSSSAGGLTPDEEWQQIFTKPNPSSR